MRLNSGLVVNSLKSILGSVCVVAGCAAVGIRTGCVISVIMILMIEDYQTCATSCWQKVVRVGPKKLSLSVRLILYAAGRLPAVNQGGMAEESNIGIREFDLYKHTGFF